MEQFLKLNKDKSETGSYVKQAEHIWSMLDDMASSSPESYKNFIEKTLKEGKEAMKPPEAHMCVKTSITSGGVLYVNFFEWNSIPGPKTDEDPIPVFGKEIEKQKSISVTNLAFNPEILQKFGKNCEDEEEREMLIQLAFSFVEQQNKIQIDKSNFKVVSNTTCYGDIKYCIRQLTNKNSDSGPSDIDIATEALNSLGQSKQIPDSILKKISTLNTNQASNKTDKPVQEKPLIEMVNAEKPLLPTYEEKIIPEKDDEKKSIFELKIYLPKLNSINECDLDIDDDFITLNADTSLYKPLSVSLSKLNEKYEKQIENIEAKFIKKTSLLRVRVPLIVKN